MKRINSGDLAIAMEHSPHVLSYIGKYLKFNGNSAIFFCSDIKASAVTPCDRPHVDLRFLFEVTDVMTKQFNKMQLSVSFEISYVDAATIPAFIVAKLKENVMVIKDSTAIEVLYGQKEDKLSFNGQAHFQNGRYSPYKP